MLLKHNDFKSINDELFGQEGICERIDFFLIFKHVVSLKKCTLPYIDFVFICPNYILE